MKRANKLLIASALVSACFVAAPVNAGILLNLVDAPGQTNTPYALTFIAGAASTVISFAGYQVPNFEYATNIGLFLNNTGSSLIGGDFTNFTLTPAGSGSLVTNPGNGLGFGGTTAGSYDTFSQSVATTPGASYTLQFLYSNSEASAPSGFRVAASEARVGAVPEPATWAMMLVGFGVAGASIRYRRRKTSVSYT